LGLIFAALIATTLVAPTRCLITVAALGLPLLFLIYLQESDVYRDVPTSTLVVTAGSASASASDGTLTGAMVAQAYDVGLGMGIGRIPGPSRRAGGADRRLVAHARPGIGGAAGAAGTTGSLGRLRHRSIGRPDVHAPRR